METLLTECETGKWIHVKPGTLRRWRHENRGPPWLRIEGAVRYSPKELKRYLASKRRTSTRPRHRLRQ
jgi:hypothetical protein